MENQSLKRLYKQESVLYNQREVRFAEKYAMIKVLL